MVTAILKITGRVQGVFFRANAKSRAVELGLSGYAKNRADGSVESVAQGEKAQIEKYIEWCKKGPPSAEVSGVEIEWRKEEKIYSGFISL